MAQIEKYMIWAIKDSRSLMAQIFLMAYFMYFSIWTESNLSEQNHNGSNQKRPSRSYSTKLKTH